MANFGLLVLVTSFVGLFSFGSSEQVKRHSNNVARDVDDSAEKTPIRTQPFQSFLTHWAQSTQPQLILIAEHKQQTSLDLQATLHKEGYNTIIAENGKQAFASALRYKPDLILVDADLPILNGLQATHFMRKNPTTRAIPIIVLTNDNKASDNQALFAAGANAAIEAPSFVDTLSTTVTRLLHPA